MAELVTTDVSQARGPAGQLLEKCCKFFAVIAGLVLTGMAFMSIVSITGRLVLSSPIVGDYELVQMLCAIAVSMSLPYTHWIKGHVIVDFFTVNANPRFNAALDSVAHLLLAFFSVVLTWRMWVSTWELKAAEDASMLLSIPTWWTYLPMVASFALLSLTSLYTAANSLKEITA